MSTIAFKGSGAQLKLGNGLSPEVFTHITEAVSMSNLGVRNDLLEVTHLQSTAKEYISGLADGVEVEIIANYIPANAQQNALLIAANAGTTKNLQAVLPPGGGSLTFTFAVVMLGWNLSEITANAPQQIHYFGKITGAISGPS